LGAKEQVEVSEFDLESGKSTSQISNTCCGSSNRPSRETQFFKHA